jgi:hippurate hydrolase
VIGLMKNGAGPVVLVRTDMDALPVDEQTDLPYASHVTTKDNAGKEVHVMHACGHDAHMAIFIGVARALEKLKDEWRGTIEFVGQPAEETGAGAKALLDGGLYEKFPKPNFAIGYHDNAELPRGEIGVTPGYTFANVDSVDITVRGVGGHGAYPHKTKDPVVLAAQIILGLQTIVSRENNPLDPVVITVGSIHGGTKHNIISDEVKMQLTVRTYKSEVRQHVLDAIARVAKGDAIAAGFPEDKMPLVQVEKDEFTPSTYNNPQLTERLIKDWKQAIGADNVVKTDPTMGGEDFSEYSLPDHSIPACDFWIGAVAPEKIAESEKSGRSLPSLHSPKFAPVPEPTIKLGIIGVTTAVLDLMKK